MRYTSTHLIASLSLALLGSHAIGEETPRRNVEGIADNSFLVEEAYNQESGVVQHIVTGLLEFPDASDSGNRNWEAAFTQEWPFLSQRHQLSYTLPYHFVEDGNSSVDGLGDIQLHYRYQLLFEEETLTAFAPRISLLLPTGDDDRGLGEGTVGYQVNLPFSTAIGDFWFLHLNAGTTFLPDAASAGDRDLWGHHLGASVIYAATPELHFMLEWVGSWDETLTSSGRRRYDFSTVVLPGVRKAFNLSTGAQLVTGLGIPIGINDSAPDIGAFLYVSFEHSFSSNDQK